MNKQTQELFIAILTVKTLEQLKQYDVEGVDWKAKNKDDCTLAHYCAYNKNAAIEILQYLFDKGVDLYALNKYGESAIGIYTEYIKIKDIEIQHLRDSIEYIEGRSKIQVVSEMETTERKKVFNKL